MVIPGTNRNRITYQLAGCEQNDAEEGQQHKLTILMAKKKVTIRRTSRGTMLPMPVLEMAMMTVRGDDRDIGDCDGDWARSSSAKYS